MNKRSFKRFCLEFLSIIATGIGDSDLNLIQEESPSCCKTVFHLTNGRSNTRESATENRLPRYKW